MSFVPRRTVLLILSGAALTACQPVPPSYYDWLDAGAGYYDYAPLFEGGVANACRLRDANAPRACRIESGRFGSSGFGAFGHPLSSARMSGMTGGGPTGAGHNAGGTSAGGHAAHGGGAGGGHGGHGGR